MEGFSHPGIERRSLNVTSDSNVNVVIAGVIEKEGRIDIVVNNAGVMCHGASCDSPILVVQLILLTVRCVCRAIVGCPH